MPTQLSATPPARHRSRMPVSRCANAVIFSITSSVISWIDRARSISRCVSVDLGLPRRAAEQRLDLRAGHRQAVRVGEVLLVHPQAAIVADLDEVVLDGLDVLRLAVRREAHHLVFAGVHLEAGEVGECGIQQAERMREAQLVQDLERAARGRRRSTRSPTRRRRPSSRRRPARTATDRTPRRRAIRGARRTAPRPRSRRGRSRMSSAIHSFSPSHSGIAIRYDRQPARRARDVGLEQPLELDERLLVEADVIDLRRRDAGFAQAVLDRLRRKRRVVLLAREALLLRRRDDAAVLDQAGGRIVVVGGDSEDARSARLEQRVDERRDRARLREHDQQAEQDEHDDDRQQPVFLLLPSGTARTLRERDSLPWTTSIHPREMIGIAITLG